ncbi:ephrin-A4-like [Anguilla anguilla]|uniref:ephrin-A4-like n=1 Tax=Anguilla anguilla TaxID=7936 RepID=UPI0015B19D67|nr:ephrin-A4-like [Anguilla anguilla]
MGWYGPGAGTIWKMTVLFLQLVSLTHGKRHVVYWNSTNTRLSQGDLSIDVDPGDYLDIFCPHYPPGAPASSPPETLVLYLARGEDFRGCGETRGATKRWECNRPRAPLGPVRFTEKIQRFTPFSSGFEFRSGYHYYYSSLATKDGPELPCMKLRVAVCCGTGTPAPHGAVGASAARPQLSLLLLIPLFLHSSV